MRRIILDLLLVIGFVIAMHGPDAGPIVPTGSRDEEAVGLPGSLDI